MECREDLLGDACISNDFGFRFLLDILLLDLIYSRINNTHTSVNNMFL